MTARCRRTRHLVLAVAHPVKLNDHHKGHRPQLEHGIQSKRRRRCAQLSFCDSLGLEEPCAQPRLNTSERLNVVRVIDSRLFDKPRLSQNHTAIPNLSPFI